MRSRLGRVERMPPNLETRRHFLSIQDHNSVARALAVSDFFGVQPLLALPGIAVLFGVSRAKDRDPVAQPVVIAAGPSGRAWIAILAWLVRPPRPREAVRCARNHERNRAVLPLLDPVASERANVLVAVQHDHIARSLQDGQRTVARRLRPTPAVEVNQPALESPPGVRGGLAEDRLRAGQTEVGVDAVARPTLQERFLARPEQLRALDVDDGGIRPPGCPLLGDEDVCRARLELAILDDRKARAAIAQLCEVHLDPARAGCRVDRIGQVAGLGALHRIDPVNLHQESASLKTGAVRRPGQGTPALSPNIALEDIVVVGNDDAGAILQDRAPRPPELPVLAQVVEHRLLARLAAGDTEPAIALVDLVTGEERNVGILDCDVADHATLRKDLPVIAGEHADPQLLLVARVFANDAAPVVLLPLERISDAVLDVARCVPTVDPEDRRARQALDGNRGDRRPARSPACLEPRRPLVLIAEWREMRRELEYSPAQRVLRPQDRTKGLIGMRC